MAGNSLSQYRAAIGLFSTKSDRIPLNGHVVIVQFMGFAFHWMLMVLLKCGDIELNPGPSEINGILLNCRSLKSVNSKRNKMSELQSLVSLKHADIVCLTETWLTADIASDEILPHDTFSIYRKDRAGGYGGVLVGIHQSIKSKLRCDLMPDDTDHNELIVVEIRLPKLPKIALINFYRPPTDNSLQCINNFTKTLKKVQESGFHKIWVMGDFNLPNLDIVTGLPRNNEHNCLNFYECFHDHGLMHLVNDPTHQSGNRLDLLMASCPELFQNISVEKYLFSSDHYLINFSIKTDRKPDDKVPRKVYNYKKADWNGLRNEIQNSHLCDLIYSCGNDINAACKLWTSAIQKLINKFIPQCKLKNINSPPWIDGEVIHMSNKKDTAHRKARTKDTPESWTKYKKLRNKLKNLVDSKYHHYIEDTTAAIDENPKRFWSLLKSKCKKKTIPQEIHRGQTKAESPDQKATLFNDFFQSNFTNNANASFPNVNSLRNRNLCDLSISIAETRLIMQNININKATGPDNIPGRVLKECAKELSPSLTKLFNLSLTTGTVPDDWKMANVTPVHKKGDRSACSNYRPISLLCICSKILERAILNQIYNEIVPLITKFQHGFLKGKSTETQLLEVYDNISKVLDDSGQSDIIFLDLSKAFDSVPHNLLVHKLTTFGFQDNLLNWFSSYLKNRVQRVVLEGSTSTWLPVGSGVPQGSILGPVLFLLYINDMVNVVSENTAIGLFADDAKIFRNIKTMHDCEILQEDLNSLLTWSNTWKLQFNLSKCKLLRIYRALKFAYDYKMENSVLETVTEFNDLGVLVSSDLTWNNHIAHKISRANSLLGFIKRAIGFKASKKAKRTLYLSFIRSTVMYNSTIWHLNKTHLKLLEGIQRRATKFILNDYNSDYKTRLKECNLLPLCYYKELRDLYFFYKSINNFFHFDVNNMFTFNINRDARIRQNVDPLSLKLPPFKTETGAAFYSVRLVKLWNSLPMQIRTLKSKTKEIALFKKRTTVFYNNHLENKFDVENTCTWVTHCRCPLCRET